MMLSFVGALLLVINYRMGPSMAFPLHDSRVAENAIIRVENSVTKLPPLERVPDEKSEEFLNIQPQGSRGIMEEIYSRIKTNTKLYQILTSKNTSCAFVYLRTEGSNGSKTRPYEEHFQDVRIEVVNEFVENQQEMISTNNTQKAHSYDHRGAMYFAVAVITIYGLSIALLIASSVRRSGEDYELKGFIRSFTKLRVSRMMAPRDKFMVGRALLDSGALLRLTAQGHVPSSEKQFPALLLSNDAITSSTSSKFSAVTSSSVGNSCATLVVNSGQESSEGSLESGALREEAGTSPDVAQDCNYEEEEDDEVFVSCPDTKDEGREGQGLPAQCSPAGPRHVKIYQGKERGKIDVRSVDVALDIPEHSAI